MTDQPFAEDNARELQRLRDLVARLSDLELQTPVNEHWTVAGVLGHVAFWDARALYLAERFDPATGFPDDVGEPENVDWINDSTRALIHAIEPRRAAELTVQAPRRSTRGSPSCRPARSGRTIPTARSTGSARRTGANTSTRSRPRWASDLPAFARSTWCPRNGSNVR